MNQGPSPYIKRPIADNMSLTSRRTRILKNEDLNIIWSKEIVNKNKNMTATSYAKARDQGRPKLV